MNKSITSQSPFFCRAILCTALCLGLSLYSASSIAKDEISMSFQSVLQQERTWAGLENKTLKVGDITWSYSESNNSSKPTILFIHGLAGSRDNWNRVARYLSTNYHVVIPDLPGSGSTTAPQDFDYSVPNVTEKLRRFIEAAQITGPIHIAGHSLGGSIAMLYAGQYPFETKSLFLLNSAGVYRSGNTPYLKDPALLKQLLVTKKGDFAYLFKQATYNPPFIPKEIQDAQEKMMIQQSIHTQKTVDQLIALNKLYTPDSFAILMRSIDAPTLILWGKQDKLVNVEVAHELKSLLKHAETPVVLENVGHMPILEAEQLVVQSYLPFLTKVQAQKSPTTSTP